MSGTFDATVTRRTVVADASGKLWDLGNPNFVAISTSDGGITTDLEFAVGATVTGVTIAFSVASAAFNAS